MERLKAYQNEKEKLEKLFEKAEPEVQKLTQGLIKQAAFLYAENAMLDEMISTHGSLVVNPARPSMQRSTEAAKLYLKNAGMYAATIRTLGQILNKNIAEEEDEFEKFLAEQRAANDG